MWARQRYPLRNLLQGVCLGQSSETVVSFRNRAIKKNLQAGIQTPLKPLTRLARHVFMAGCPKRFLPLLRIVYCGISEGWEGQETM